MRFRHRVKNKKVIVIVLAIIMAFVAIITSCNNNNQKYSNNTCQTNVTYQDEQKHVKLVPRSTYHTQGNVYIQNGKHMKVGATAYTNDPITSTGTKPSSRLVISTVALKVAPIPPF